jgi:hypothetical protein
VVWRWDWAQDGPRHPSGARNDGSETIELAGPGGEHSDSTACWDHEAWILTVSRATQIHVHETPTNTRWSKHPATQIARQLASPNIVSLVSSLLILPLLGSSVGARRFPSFENPACSRDLCVNPRRPDTTVVVQHRENGMSSNICIKSNICRFQCWYNFVRVYVKARVCLAVSCMHVRGVIPYHPKGMPRECVYREMGHIMSGVPSHGSASIRKDGLLAR